MSSNITHRKIFCYHCGEPCLSVEIGAIEKSFCCEGCKMVYQILNQNDLCDYYDLNKTPGISQRGKIRRDKFAFLDDEKTQVKLCSFRDEQRMHITFYLPQVHCSSCLYLLENLHRLDQGIISARVNIAKKEVDIIARHPQTSLRKIAELLTSIGYEPYISLDDLKNKQPARGKAMIYQLGIAGFCFANIMLISFPEYLGIDATEAGLRNVFRWINFGLAIPVFLYSALPFYISSWKSLKKRFLNIDTPIALAIIITFSRSVYEVISGSGGGYFDSMSGIVFFMLVGRILQDKTYRHLSFDREYTSYFPVAVSILKEGKEMSTTLPDIIPGVTLLIHHEELIPADGILTRGKALIDYSFVTGESLPLIKEIGELVYAGGKQTGSNIEILVMKEVAQSYLTKLWNHESFKKNKTDRDRSFVHLLSRYFTYIVFTVAAGTAIYWQLNDVSKLWPAVTAIFIIACPCALLLSSAFTNGNILQVLGRNHFYLRNAQTIEEIARVTHIVFDKTGTLTTTLHQHIRYEGTKLTKKESQQVSALAACSSHPLSKALAKLPGTERSIGVAGYKETPGQGIEGFTGEDLVRIGSFHFVTGKPGKDLGTNVFISIENELKGYFIFRNHYREDIAGLLGQLKKRYKISVLTGDNDSERENLENLLGKKAAIRFHQHPEDKLRYIRHLQEEGEVVMMVGDGLNDAGALKQSDIGIAVTEQNNNFTPSSDAILAANQLSKLSKFMLLCHANKKIVSASFALSILYNLTGLYFAVQGNLSPLIAAILMPASSLSILLLTFGGSNLLARRFKL